MPIRPNPLLAGAQPTPSTRPNPLLSEDVPETTTPEAESSFPWGKAALSVGALAALGLLAHQVPTSVTGIAEGANSLRQQSMLSGFAPVKSFLGNVGAAIEQSALRRSLDPLKEFLSPTTVKDAISEYRMNTVPPGITKFPDWLPTPGRVMQSLDTATQNAMQRAGLSATEAQDAVLQGPLPPKLQRALDSPIGRYMIPFRRTPFNQFIQGFDRLRLEDPVVTGGYGAAGFAHGAATAKDDHPLSLPLAISLAGTHGVPYALAAIAGRAANGGTGPDSEAASSVLPVSEYGLSQSAEDPLAPFTHPAALSALQKLIGR